MVRSCGFAGEWILGVGRCTRVSQAVCEQVLMFEKGMAPVAPEGPNSRTVHLFLAPDGNKYIYGLFSSGHVPILGTNGPSGPDIHG